MLYKKIFVLIIVFFVVLGNFSLTKAEIKYENNNRYQPTIVLSGDIDGNSFFMAWGGGWRKHWNRIKKAAKKIAEKAKLHTATKKDSQGICFLGKIPMKDFLSHFIEEKEGKVLNESGEEIGIHPGALFFTLGERHGFLITKKGSDDKPYYVIKKDIEKNALTVSNDPLKAVEAVEMANQSIGIESLHFISEKPKEGIIYQVRSRYRQKTVSAYINQFKNEAEVSLVDAKLIAPSGQSLVIYDGDICIGGGIVK